MAFDVFGGKLKDSLKDIITFSEDEAASITKRVIENKDSWIDRDYFWTLGASAYIDTAEEYVTNTPIGNKTILQLFSNELNHAMESISKSLLNNIKYIFLPRAAIPGFHIINERSNGKSGRFHVDISYQNVMWCSPFIWPFSFTTLLSTPEVGSGMWYWDDFNVAQLRHYKDMYTEDLPEDGRELLTYEVGHTYIHLGRVPHALANTGDIKDGEFRITLQGHGAYLPEEKCIAVYF